ncbi:hypothetical protein [Bradyrhizobium prioriisuperbiae]|uniref:hypothetical protein n=1 Tax=Bradyrhizobium prioriisuperbiae TaxID=2854389 RepID=UPI0028E4427A|nr:hypothetical protein [Bradyrhizobium prioritasuperba]
MANLTRHLARIEPGNRLVVLARTIQAPDPEAETALKDSAVNWARFGDTCLGQALYRHRSVSRNTADAPVWSHLELSYFRDLVPADVILELVVRRQPPEMHLLRAEILLTTPSSFILPRDWQGSADRPERQASLEYIDVQSRYLRDYRDVMRDYCGPAAAKLVRANRIGTFRAMETAAVLYRDPALTIDWNQIHLCELDADGFNGFGREFEAALREDSQDAAGFAADIFAGLDRIRTVPRWTFNDPVVEADMALGREGTMEP